MIARRGAVWRWLQLRLEAYKEVHPRLISSVVMIGAAIASALVAIAYAKGIDWANETMIRVSRDFKWAFLVASPLWFILSWALVKYLGPEASGSGIPQVMAAIDQAATNRGLGPSVGRSLRLVTVKIASSLSATLSGGILGREGPTIQISALLFELFDGLFKRYVSSRRSREALLIAGGGAGLAAAFNTPLGGVVFAIEELASQHFKTFKGMLILTVVTAGYVTQAVLGPYLYIGHPAIGVVTPRDTMIGLTASAGIGILGALFGVVLFKAMTWTRSLNTKRKLALAAAVGAAMSLACLLIGPDASGSGTLLIRKLLFGTAKEAAEVGWALALWRMVGMTLTYISGCAGGIFAPSLGAGAAIGAVLASTITVGNHSLIIVLGMIAFLTGATRSPFTCFILVFEMTDRQAAVMPMMASALIASIAAKLVDRESFYEKTKNVILTGSTTAAGKAHSITSATVRLG